MKAINRQPDSIKSYILKLQSAAFLQRAEYVY